MFLSSLTEIPSNVSSLDGLAAVTSLSLVGQEIDLTVPGISSTQVYLNASTPVGTAMYLIKDKTDIYTSNLINEDIAFLCKLFLLR